MCHQLGTEVTDGKEVVCPFNQFSVLLIEDWQTVETHTDTHTADEGEITVVFKKCMFSSISVKCVPLTLILMTQHS